MTQTLEPGKYAVADINSNALAEFEVTGDGGEDEPEAPAATHRRGRVQLQLERAQGRQERGRCSRTRASEPHFVVGLPIKQGKTIDDVKTFLRTEKGEPPVQRGGQAAFDTAVFDGGDKQVVDLDLKKGKYAFVCFIPDRKGGPPHVAKGMIAEADVQ